MKHLNLLIIYLAVLVNSVSGQGISFEKNLTWQELLVKARQENKYILVDAFTTWCEPCKKMDMQTFSQREVGDFMNDKYLSVKVQMDRTANDAEAARNWYSVAAMFQSQYEIHAYPTVLFFNPQGKLISRAVGYMNGSGLIREARKAVELNGEYGELISRFNKGELSNSNLKDLAKKAQEFKDYDVANAAATTFANNLSRKDRFHMNNLVFIGSHMTSRSRYFGWFLKNAKRINAIVSKNFTETEIMRVIYQEEIEPHDKQQRPDWQSVEKRVVAKYGDLGQERVWGNMLVYYCSAKDWKSFAKYYKLYFDRAIPNERSFIHINNLSWPVFEHVTDSAVLNTAIKTMEYNLDKFQRYDPAAIDTYANLLYKAWRMYGIGKKEHALWWSELSVKLSNHEKVYEDTWNKMIKDQPTWVASENDVP